MTAETLTLSALYYYPVKSCGGTALQNARIGARGIEHDREWMIVSPAGKFITQRELPRMALITVDLDMNTDCLRLYAPGLPPLELPASGSGERKTVVIWQSTCQGLDQGELAAQWLSTYLQKDARLVRMADDFVRPVKAKYAPRPSDQVGFADGYPFLLISEGSLADLNRRLAQPLPMNRFRPNLVVSGAQAYAEDNWRQIRIGAVTFDVVKPCLRCAITTTDQETAARSKEPLRTLAAYRKVPYKGVKFGQNLVHAMPGTLSVGMPIEVIS